MYTGIEWHVGASVLSPATQVSRYSRYVTNITHEYFMDLTQPRSFLISNSVPGAVYPIFGTILNLLSCSIVSSHFNKIPIKSFKTGTSTLSMSVGKKGEKNGYTPMITLEARITPRVITLLLTTRY